MNFNNVKNNSQDSKKDKLWNTIYNIFEKRVSDLNSLHSHQGLKGEENERTLIKFLKSFLPGKYQIEQRKILLDQEGKESTEQDIIIWNSKDYPRIFSDTNFFLFESVLMCMEVKTTLDNENLKETLLKIQNLRKLKYFKRLNGDERWQVHPPLCFIFAYDCIWKKFGSILNYVKSIIEENNINPSERFDYLYIMRKGILLSWDVPEINSYKEDHSILLDFKKKYGGVIPYNERWPQFFPSKLIEEKPLILFETQIWQEEGFKEGFFNDLTIENQTKGMINFLINLCQALEDQKIFHTHGHIMRSYTGAGVGRGGGRYSIEPF